MDVLVLAAPNLVGSLLRQRLLRVWLNTTVEDVSLPVAGLNRSNACSLPNELVGGTSYALRDLLLGAFGAVGHYVLLELYRRRGISMRALAMTDERRSTHTGRQVFTSDVRHVGGGVVVVVVVVMVVRGVDG